jgi:hypothetical protein
VQTDNLSGFHSNTHIPVVVGAQMRYEVTGDELYKTIAEYFLKFVNSSHSYVTGGTSSSEFWWVSIWFLKLKASDRAWMLQFYIVRLKF